MPTLICDAIYDPQVVAKLPLKRQREYARLRNIAIEAARKIEEAEALLRHNNMVLHAAELHLSNVYYGK